ncbi:MAG TPA: antibiotic biosynthesis monooxygenase [Methanoregulaceae archaeon]|nr:antibiotic biosynthesis monooxygenase [Methanoregulaceae archaeon]
MITIVARGSVQADRVADLERLAVDLVEASRNEEGNVSYDFYADLADPAKFTFIEVWKDRDAIDLHNATSHFQGFVERAGPLFDGPLDIALCRKLT